MTANKKIFKFGGASVKDAEGVRNLAAVLKMFTGEELVVVISAMGKMTNALERLHEASYSKAGTATLLQEIKSFHFNIIDELFADKQHSVYTDIHNAFVELEWAVEEGPTLAYDHAYDQVVCLGEILSTKIVAAYLNDNGANVQWRDVRDMVKTDDTFREGKVDWELTERLVKENFKTITGSKISTVITQGFLGCTSENYTTTLGREGSDYTAAILAFCLGAESVTIWKDVPGVLNADPKWFDETSLIGQLSYHDAIELSYYGATVIHPKTIKPLQNKNIPLYVRSFVKPKEKGTVINEVQSHLPIPCFIFKVDQMLVSISPKDFSFIAEENFSDIFRLCSDHGVKINTMQNSAISFSLCIDNNERKVPGLLKELQKNYRVLYNDNVELITIRYYDQATIDRVTRDKKVFLEVKSRYTVQLVVKGI